MSHNIDVILERYWEGETSVEEEILLKEYFQKGNVAAEHKLFCDLFDYFDEQSNIVMPKIIESSIGTNGMAIEKSIGENDMDQILKKYWEGETSLEEEETLRSYFKSDNVSKEHSVYCDLFGYFNQQSNISFPATSPGLTNSNIITIFRQTNFKRYMVAAAAVFILAISSVFVVQNLIKDSDKKTVAMVQEIDDPEEALRITRQALAMVSSKFNKSKQTVKENMGELEKASIFK